MKILITGATGFIGARIARQLLAEGHCVRAAYLESDDRSRVDDILADLEVVPGNIFTASDEQLSRLAEDIELCIHTAWHVIPGDYLESPENLTCLNGSLRLFRALGIAGCRRIAGLGTCFEYDFEYGYLSEKTPTLADSLYSAAKTATFRMGERIALNSGMEFVWPRIFYLYGPGEHSGRLIPYTIQTLLKREEATFSSGTQIKDFLHVDDVASGITRAAMDGSLSGPVNIGSGYPTTVREMVTFIAEELNAQYLVKFEVRPDNPTDPPFLLADNRKLLGTGWTPRYNLAEGLQAVINWWRSQDEC